MLYIYPGNWLLRIFMAHAWNQCIWFYGPTWHIFNGIFMTHEIKIIISHFSRPLKSPSVIFMAHGIYNTPTLHGSWTLMPDISWQFHEPWKPVSKFHGKFMAWKIGHENEISVLHYTYIHTYILYCYLPTRVFQEQWLYYIIYNN